MSELSLMVVRGAENMEAVGLIVPAEATAFKAELISMASKVVKIADADDQQYAVDTCAQIKRLLKNLESCRVDAGAPFKAIVDQVNGASNTFKKELVAERDRLQSLLDIREQEVEMERRRIEEERLRAVREAEMAKLKAEREANQAIADAQAAKGKKAREIAEKAALEAKLKADLAALEESKINLAITPQVDSASRTYGRKEYKWEVTDLLKFAIKYPNLVTIEPKRALINQMAASGELVADSTIKVWESRKAVVQL